MTHGLFLIDKSPGMTSHDVVAQARRLLGTRAIGHAGTLDPMATGLLILCVGNATRLSEYLLGEDKTYIATVRLGERTNTDDAEGEVIERREVAITPDDIERARARFAGEIQQVPPQFSAISKGGVRAYALARKGEVVALDARRVTIYALSLSITVADPHLLSMSVECSSGTYVRALARDIGEALGCGAHLASLRRTRIGGFGVNDALRLEDTDTTQAIQHMLPMDTAIAHFPRVQLNGDQARRFVNGQAISIDGESPAQALCRVYDGSDQFMGVGDFDDRTQSLRPHKVLLAQA